MSETQRRSTFLGLVPAVQEPQIVLAALTRLRWLAVVGQVTATAVAAGPMRLHLPLWPIFGVILITAVSNGLLHLGSALHRTPGWLVQAVLLLDVILLTSLLFLTGGPQNPFASLYLVHVTMAVLFLGSRFTWLIVATVAACYGALLRWHLPLEQLPWGTAIGNWLALVLVSVLIGAFIGRLTRDLRQREHELADVRDRAVKNEQLAALTTLAAGAAHELNTPLGTIALVARELELACDRNAVESMQDDARLIRREVDRCRHILSRMRLDLGEEASFRTAIELGDLSARLVENFDEPLRSRLQIIRAADVKIAYAPLRALEQSLLVLLRNAFDASPADAKVTLAITRGEGKLSFEVSDRGSGMSRKCSGGAGQPFFTTKEPGRGMGLGLFLVRLVAEQAGAEFTIDSRVGEGTRCMLELPDAQGNGHAR